MSHYSDAYEYEYEQERKARKTLLEQQLADLKEFYMWKPDRVRMWSWNGEVDRLYRKMITEIQSELYTMKDE